MNRLATLVILFCLTQPAVAQQSMKPWSAASKRVKPKQLGIALLGAENYSDRYTIEAWLSDGTRAYVSVVVSNLGPGDYKMNLKSRFTDKSGKQHRFSKKLSRSGYKVSTSPFLVEAAGHRLSGDPKAFVVQAHSGKYKYKLNFKSGLKPWQPGSGRVTFSGNRHFEHVLVQPGAVVTGTVNGKPVKGKGYVIHTQGNIAPYSMFKWFLSVRSLAPGQKTTLWMKQFKAPAKSGGKRTGYIYVAHGGRVYATTAIKIKAGKIQKDSKHENQYKVPFQLKGTSNIDGVPVEVLIRATAITKRTDALKSRNFAERVIIKQFAQPVSYTLDARATVKIGGKVVLNNAKAAYELDYLNK